MLDLPDAGGMDDARRGLFEMPGHTRPPATSVHWSVARQRHRRCAPAKRPGAQRTLHAQNR
ncbi:hypothetical protein ACFOPN_22000 [Xanthomonas hyacinthi]|uniref:hypothetical protein n=1 Tax=Xanthomonas hyacinthi TaxID=56455 RepID=UPI00360AAD31